MSISTKIVRSISPTGYKYYIDTARHRLNSICHRLSKRENEQGIINGLRMISFDFGGMTDLEKRKRAERSVFEHVL